MPSFPIEESAFIHQIQAKEKLEPFWLAQVVPYLENSSLLQFTLPAQRDKLMRKVLLSQMRGLKKHKLIAAIPQKFERDAPKIKLLALSVPGKPTQELPVDKLSSEVGGVIGWGSSDVEVQEGEDFSLIVMAGRSAVGLQKPRTTTMQETTDFGMRMWFLASQSSDSTLSFRQLVRDGDDTDQFVAFGQKLRRKTLSCNEEDGSVSCSLPIRGRHAQHNYALLERGTELTVRVICEENWAYENDSVTIRIRIVAPEVQSGVHPDTSMDALMDEVENVGAERSSDTNTSANVRAYARHIPHRLTAPTVFGNARTEEELRETYVKSARFLNLRHVDLNHVASADELKFSAALERFSTASSTAKEDGPVLQRAKQGEAGDSTDSDADVVDENFESSGSEGFVDAEETESVFLTPRGRGQELRLAGAGAGGGGEPGSAQLHRSMSSIEMVDENRQRLVHAVLAELGHSPSDDDVEYCLRRISEKGQELDEDAFVEFYAESNWAKPMLAEVSEQFEQSVREMRNKFLLESMKLPTEQWGFGKSDWGFPDMDLWKQHSANLAKEQLHEIWVARNDVSTTRHPRQLTVLGVAWARAAADYMAKRQHTASAAAADTKLNLKDKDKVQEAPLLKVVEELSVSFTKHYLGRALPTDRCDFPLMFDCFATVLRLIWVCLDAQCMLR